MAIAEVKLKDEDVGALLSGRGVGVKLPNPGMQPITEVSVRLADAFDAVDDPEAIHERALDIGALLHDIGPTEVRKFGPLVTIVCCGATVYSSIGNMVRGFHVDFGLTFKECIDVVEGAMRGAIIRINEDRRKRKRREGRDAD